MNARQARTYIIHFGKMSLPNGIESTQELLAAQAHVWNHMYSLINSMSLKCAIQLCIPDIIHKHNKPITLSQLIHSLPINKAKSSCLARLMRILIHSKFFINVKISDDEEEKGYWLTPASRLLLRDEPLSVAPLALSMLDPVLVDPWHHVSEWFQNDRASPFVTKHGRTLWEYAKIDQSWNQLFNEAMASDARFVSSVVIKECRQVFEGVKSMVDVGGGIGTVARAITEAFPGLKCIVLDLPHVVDGLEGDNKLRYVGGDMFESIPPADAVFLKWIFHDWSDEECIKLLGKCKEAILMEKGGIRKVIIVEMVVGDDNEKEHNYNYDDATQTQLFFDMLMMTEVSGKERSEKEWGSLFLAAGFTHYNITPILGLRSVIEVFP